MIKMIICRMKIILIKLRENTIILTRMKTLSNRGRVDEIAATYFASNVTV